MGKWVRPNYNSAVGTFCNNIANDLPITVNDPSVELEMLFIDDLVEEMFDAIEGKEHHCEFDGVNAIIQDNGRYCYAHKMKQPLYAVSIDEIPFSDRIIAIMIRTYLVRCADAEQKLSSVLSEGIYCTIFRLHRIWD